MTESKFCEHHQTNHDLTPDFWYFSKKKNGKITHSCKAWKNAKNNAYNNKNKDALLEKQRAAYHLNPDKAKAKRESLKDYNKEYQAKYRAEHKEDARERNRSYRERNRERVRESLRQYYVDNKEKMNQRKEDPAKVNSRYVERYKNDKNFKLKANLRNRLRQALQNSSKIGSAVELLGCDVPFAVAHIESQFYPNPITNEPMTWDSHTRLGWHIDHIVPLDSFDLQDPNQLAKACHYTNLRPLWAAENIQKSNKVASQADLELELSKLGLPMAKVDAGIFGISLQGRDLCVRMIDLKPETSPCYEILDKYSNSRIMQFLPHEVSAGGDIVVSMIRNFFGQSQKINARDCSIRSIKTDEARGFMDANHLMGYVVSAKYFGLYYGADLVSVMGYKKHETGIDISRFATKRGMTVRGAFTKLLSFLEKNVKIMDKSPEYIQSYCDLRYASGSSYATSGFELIGISWGFLWSDGFRTYNRMRCRANMDERKLSEAQHARELGLFKIYDAGQAKYIKKLR